MNSSRIDQEAAAWVVAHDRGLTPAEQDEFSDWLAHDPRHRAAFQAHKASWQSFGLLEEWRPRHSTEPNPDILDSSVLRRLRRHQIWLVGATALTACLAVAVWGAMSWLESRSLRASPDATPGETAAVAASDRQVFTFSSEATRFVALPDGSEIDLNADTEGIVTYSENLRLIDVLRGEAYFTVAKDAERPFDVRARGATVRAVGTQFGVKLESDRVAVVVSEGRVLFGQSRAVEQAAPEGDLAGAVSLTSGNYSSLPLEQADAQPEVRELAGVEASALLSWKPAVLEFSGLPLADVVAEFNRQNDVQITIVDDSIRHLPLAGSFRANNVQGFVNLLEVTGAARVRHISANEIQLLAP